jgi:hypothetical protein
VLLTFIPLFIHIRGDPSRGRDSSTIADAAVLGACVKSDHIVICFVTLSLST